MAYGRRDDDVSSCSDNVVMARIYCDQPDDGQPSNVQWQQWPTMTPAIDGSKPININRYDVNNVSYR